MMTLVKKLRNLMDKKIAINQEEDRLAKIVPFTYQNCKYKFKVKFIPSQ
jgi:hypothetical protein